MYISNYITTTGGLQESQERLTNYYHFQKKKSEMIEKSIDGISKGSVVSFVQENEKKI